MKTVIRSAAVAFAGASLAGTAALLLTVHPAVATGHTVAAAPADGSTPSAAASPANEDWN